MVKTIYWYESINKKKRQKDKKWFRERLLQTNEQFSLWKDYGKKKKHGDLKLVTT